MLEKPGRAPNEEPDIKELTSTDVKVDEKPVARRTDSEILDEDFKYLEMNVVGGESGKSLSELQRGFKIDQVLTQAEVDAFNAQKVDGKVTSAWNVICMARRGYECPFPGDRAYLPDKCDSMNLRFDQPSWLWRVSDLAASQRATGVAFELDIAQASWAAQFPQISSDRKDAHVIITGITLTSSNTIGLPFSTEIAFWSGTAEGGQMRKWHKDVEERTAGTFGIIKHLVVEPAREFRKYSDCTIFGNNLEHLCNPWMSRLMTFNFGKFRAETLESHKIEKVPTYLRIKAPALSATFKDFTALQWLVLTFYRFLYHATKRQLESDRETNAELIDGKVGTTVLQERYEPGAKPGAAPIGYEFVISRSAIDLVVDRLEQKVRAATVMANLETVALTGSFVGAGTTSRNIDELSGAKKGMRDSIARDDFVGPLSFTVSVDFIAIPSTYPALYAQTESATGDKFRRGRGATAAVGEQPPLRTDGKAGYGTHSARHSIRSANL